MTARYACCDERRREAIRGQSALNGIDYLEVVDHDAPTEAERQRILRLHFVNAPAPPGLTVANVRLEGGERITGIGADAVSYDGEVLVVHVTAAGDFSPYLLRLVEAGTLDPLGALDPRLAEVVFSFKVECPTDLDCRQLHICPRRPEPVPEIDYLAKDFASFRRLMLDRMALLAPGWPERNLADLGTVLVELLAYAADHLSYEQDAVATEAYLGTARRRVSVRRHARLVDYAMHDGCNARAWVQITVQGPTSLEKGRQLMTRIPGMPSRFVPGSAQHERALRERPEIFETMHAVDLDPAHNELSLYTWGARECCLPAGATAATLRGPLPDLAEGMVLVFVERFGPRTGRPKDADPSHRHAVRLTRVARRQDPLGGRFLEPPTNDPVDVVDVEWAAGDALPFPLCVSSVTDEAHGSSELDAVSVALGNIVLVDHGWTIVDEPLGETAAPTLFRAPIESPEHCAARPPVPVMPRFRPRLAEGPLTQTGTVRRIELVDGQARERILAFDPESSAAEALRWRMADVLPAITLHSTGTATRDWSARRDLIESDAFSPDFVAEVEDDGIATLRFGDDEYGIRPEPGTVFTATYRVGNGTRGNVGAGAIAHIVSPDGAITQVGNPLSAEGGVELESPERVRQSAPSAFRVQERAVTEADWAEVTQRRADVQRAAATFRWTGSWHTVFDTVDRTGGLAVDPPFREDVRAYLERFRVVGHDLEVDAPRFVGLRLAMTVCVKVEYFRADVERELRDIFSNRTLPDGRRGLFDPDTLTFGQPVYLSPLYAAAQSVEGVHSVEITALERLTAPGTETLTTGKLDLGRLEIAQLDNDPDFPEHGVLELTLEGGR